MSEDTQVESRENAPTDPKELLRIVGMISKEDLELISTALQECEKVDPETWY